MELNLKGKRALISGGSSGIGLAIKEALESEGVFVINWDMKEGINLMCRVPEIPEVDIIINNIGGMGTCKSKDAKDCMQKNYGIMLDISTQFLQKRRNYGRVITISSIYGKEKGPNPFFAASKSAQIAYMKSQAGKYKNVTFNTICPGHIDVDKKFTYEPKVLGKPEDVANLVVFLCSKKANHINGSIITVDGGESHSY